MSEVPEKYDVAELCATLAAAPLLDPPPDVLRRWHAALDRLPPPTAAPGRPTHEPAPAAKHRLAPSRRALGAGILAAAASIVALLAPSVPTHQPDTSTDPAPLTLSRDDLPDIAWTLRPAQPTAPPGDQARLAGCLARLGADADRVLASRRVDLEGRPGLLLVLTTPTPGQVRTLVVTPDCGPDRGGALADHTSGR